MDVLRKIHEKHQLTILLVSHDLVTVRHYAHQVVWLRGGRVLCGPVEELLSREKIAEVLQLEFP